MDIFALCSDWDGLPMALSLPVIITEVGLVKEVAKEDVPGYLVPAEDEEAPVWTVEWLVVTTGQHSLQ